VNGGATYEHPLWDYNLDNVSVIDWWGNCLTYLVEQRACPSGRRIVGMFPISCVAFPYWTTVPRRTLRRLDCNVYIPETDKYYPVVDYGGSTVSIGCPGTFESLEVSRLEYIGWAEKARALGLKHPVDVERWMSVSQVTASKLGRIPWAPIVFALLRAGWMPNGGGVIMPTGGVHFEQVLAPQHYVCDHSAGPADTPTGNEVAIAFAPPLVTLPTPVPARCAANAATAHQVRVRMTQEKFRRHTFKSDLSGMAAEFVRMVLGDCRGVVQPLEIWELAERWTRPSQRNTVERLHTFVTPEENRRVMRGYEGGARV